MSSGGCGEPEVTVVLPTLNERGNLERLLPELTRVLESRVTHCFEIIVVDDGSTDGTRELVSEYSRRDPRVRLVARESRGLAGAIAEGVRRARGEIVVVMDADLQHPPEVVPRLVEAVRNGADIAVASRYERGGGVEGWSLYRLVVSLGATLLAWLLVPESRRTRDPMSGFFAVRRRAVRYEPVNPRGFKALLEILYENPGAKVANVPYVFRRRAWGESKLGASTILEYLVLLARLSRPFRFGLVGLTGLAVNLAVMWLLLTLGSPVPLASAVAVEASILWNFALHEVFTFKTRLGGGPGRVAARLAGFHLSSVLSALATVATATGFHAAGLNPLIGQAVGVVLGYLLNYAVSSRVWGRWGSG